MMEKVQQLMKLKKYNLKVHGWIHRKFLACEYLSYHDHELYRGLNLNIKFDTRSFFVSMINQVSEKLIAIVDYRTLLQKKKKKELKI